MAMPLYINKCLKKFGHIHPAKHVDCLYEPAPQKYGTNVQQTAPIDESPPLDKDGIKHVQNIVGSFLCNAWALDATILIALNEIADNQATPMKQTKHQVQHFLDNMSWNPNAVIHLCVSYIILNVHSDASYLTALQACSQASGYYFLGLLPINGQPICLNGAILVLCSILKFVASSAAEAELDAFFVNAKETKIL